MRPPRRHDAPSPDLAVLDLSDVLELPWTVPEHVEAHRDRRVVPRCGYRTRTSRQTLRTACRRPTGTAGPVSTRGTRRRARHGGAATRNIHPTSASPSIPAAARDPIQPRHRSRPATERLPRTAFVHPHARGGLVRSRTRTPRSDPRGGRRSDDGASVRARSLQIVNEHHRGGSE